MPYIGYICLCTNVIIRNSTRNLARFQMPLVNPSSSLSEISIGFGANVMFTEARQVIDCTDLAGRHAVHTGPRTTNHQGGLSMAFPGKCTYGI